MNKLADDITRDLLAKPATQAKTTECLACGRAYTAKTPGTDGRFCSPRYREGFDNGLGPYDPDYASKSNPRWYGGMRMGPHCFFIPCANCRTEFESKGLRCCSTECEKRYRQWEDAKSTMAEVEMERATKRKCQHSGGDMPVWLNPGTPKAKRVPATRKFCSARCKDRFSRCLNPRQCAGGRFG